MRGEVPLREKTPTQKLYEVPGSLDRHPWHTRRDAKAQEHGGEACRPGTRKPSYHSRLSSALSRQDAGSRPALSSRSPTHDLVRPSPANITK